MYFLLIKWKMAGGIFELGLHFGCNVAVTHQSQCGRWVADYEHLNHVKAHSLMGTWLS